MGPMMAMPLPGKAVRGVMLAIFAIWLSFAIGLNWGGLPDGVFLLFAGNTEAILHGEVWRLFSAPLLSEAMGGAGVLSLIMTELGLFFLTPSLEERWGGKRLLSFIALSAVLSYLLQMLVELMLPAGLVDRLVGPYWFGIAPAISAIAIAWALSFKNQVVHLFMVFPVSARMLVWWVVGFHVLYVVAGARPAGGLIAPFGGMLCGWLLGGSTPSPLRRAWLKLRLAQLDSQAEREGRRRRKARPNPGGLRVIPGGRADDDDDKGKGPDGRWLN
jgi:membrane associated rhomboid family serine protease